MSTAGRFCHIQKLGEGTYGCVYQANEKETGRVIAFKRMVVVSEDEGVPGTAIREICLLKELRHDNVVTLYEVLFDYPKITLVFELCDCDMKQYLEKRCPTGRLDPETEVRPVLKQMFAGLYYLHSHSVVHRDLKPQNVFFNVRPHRFLTLDGVWGASASGGGSSSGSNNNNNNHNGRHLTGASTGPFSMTGNAGLDTHELVVKLGDFGLARVENIPVKKYSHEVVTLWYRSPDVLMSSALYSFPVDVWSMGTIFFEMVTGRVLFGGRNEDDQMVRMMRLLGSPTKETWPSMRTYPGTNDRLERASAFVTQQRQEERARKARAAAVAAASGAAAGVNGSGSGAVRRRKSQVQLQPPAPGQPGGVFSFTEFCLEHEDEATLVNNLNTSRSSANSLRLPSELWFPSPLFDEYMTVSGFRGAVGEDGVDLLRQCLQYEPSRRITAGEVLAHPFLRNIRVPTMVFLDELSSQLSQTLDLAGL